MDENNHNVAGGSVSSLLCSHPCTRLPMGNESSAGFVKWHRGMCSEISMYIHRDALVSLAHWNLADFETIWILTSNSALIGRCYSKMLFLYLKFVIYSSVPQVGKNTNFFHENECHRYVSYAMPRLNKPNFCSWVVMVYFFGLRNQKAEAEKESKIFLFLWNYLSDTIYIDKFLFLQVTYLIIKVTLKQ